MLFFLIVIGLAGCRQSDVESVRIFAAISTIDAVEEILASEDGQQLEVETNFASTSSLEMLASRGVKVDLFLAAHPVTADRIKDSSQDVQSIDLLTNRIVLAFSDSAPDLKVAKTLEDLQGLQRIAIGDPAHVPVGQYARACLQEYGLWEPLQDRLVLASDARQALALIDQGLVDAGFVYHSDALLADNVSNWLPLDCKSARAVYPLIRFSGPRDSAAVDQVYQLFTSDFAKTVFESYGFDFVAGPEE